MYIVSWFTALTKRKKTTMVLDNELHQRKLKLKHLTLEHELTPTHRRYPSQKINVNFSLAVFLVFLINAPFYSFYRGGGGGAFHREELIKKLSLRGFFFFFFLFFSKKDLQNQKGQIQHPIPAR